MNAMVRSSSSTRVAGRSPATILQKMQSASASVIDGRLAGSLSRRMTPDVSALEADLRHLAAIDRPSASAGEREAAEWIQETLAAAGADAVIEEETAHGTYWWPNGLLNVLGGAAGLAALRGHRVVGALIGAAAAAGVADDVSGGPLWFRRRFLPHRPTWNVVAEAGDRQARETLVLVAHHDAARSGLIFHPGVPEWIGQRFPGMIERSETSPPVMRLVFGGPALIALGSLLGRRGLVRAGTMLAFGTAATLAQIGASSTVPGANDNLTGVVTLLGVARALRADPVSGIRVLLVSTGSEESFMEGMRGFLARHAVRLVPGRTRFLCIDTVGSPFLAAPECEGMLVHRDYDAQLKDLLSACAAEQDIGLRRGLRFSFATDGLISLVAGYRTALLASVTRHKAPANYHWPSDHADNVDYARVGDAVRVCDTLIRRLADAAVQPAPAPA